MEGKKRMMVDEEWDVTRGEKEKERTRSSRIMKKRKKRRTTQENFITKDITGVNTSRKKEIHIDRQIKKTDW